MVVFFIKILRRIRYELNRCYKIDTYKFQKIKNTRISNSTYIESIDKLHIGKNVFIGHFNFIDSSNGISIEEGCQITNYISILTHSSHISIRLYGENYGEDNPAIGYITGAVKIGKYTFIGPHSTLMPNTTIGKACIVKAYSMLKGDYPDFSIIAGNPAKVIGNTKDIDKPFLDANPKLREYYKNNIIN